jgi:hypothetical protein
MNVHAPTNAKTKFISWEFRGQRFTKNGKTWIRARHRNFGFVWYYCFELDEIFDSYF